VVLRNTATISDVPAEGSSPAIDDTIGTSVVRYIASGTSFIDTGLTNGTTYYYRIFAKDTNGNYSATGVEVSATPTTAPITTCGDGTNPGNATIAPGAAITDLDAVTFVTSSGTDSITAATVTLAAGTSAGLSEVRITSDDGSTTYFTAVTNPASDTVNFSGGTAIPVTTTSTQFKVRITPKSHANMPAPAGSEYAVTGTVTAFTSTNTQSVTDTASATITIDNLSPGNVTGAGATPGDTQVTVSWTNPADADFSNLVVLRNTATISDVPAEGSSPAIDDTIGTSVVRYIASGTSPMARPTITGYSPRIPTATTRPPGLRSLQRHPPPPPLVMAPLPSTIAWTRAAPTTPWMPLPWPPAPAPTRSRPSR
jgi:hypothetical protein